MKTKSFLLAALGIVLLCSFAIHSSTNWKIQDNYSIQFAGTDAKGIYKTMSGKIEFNESNVEQSKFDFKVDVSSINTGNGMKNKHAVSPKWFDAKKYPHITFRSTSVKTSGKGYEVTGDMQIHGVSKTMTIPFEFKDEVFTSSFSVNRMDFGVGTMEGMSRKVSNKIDLQVSIPVTK